MRENPRVDAAASDPTPEPGCHCLAVASGHGAPLCRKWRTLATVAVALTCIGFAEYQYLAPKRREENLIRHVLQLDADYNRRTNLNLDQLAVPADQVIDGGPGKDGIPALTTREAFTATQRPGQRSGPIAPKLVPAGQASFLRAGARVVGVVLGNEARAYPISVLAWHECINDVIAGEPIAVVYCPLCDSVAVVDRRLDDKVYEFGISGLLYNSNVLLYDRSDLALWSQVGLTAISGPNVNRSLVHLDGWEITSFEQWVDQHPNTDVLAYDTGYDRDYATNAYDRYFEHDELAFPINHQDDRLAPKVRVVGVRVGARLKAYPLSAVRESPGGVLRDQISPGLEVVLSASAEETVRIESVPDDADVVHTFWFAWAAMHPQTDLYESSPR